MNQTSDPSSTAIQIEGVWKIFGDRAIEAMAAIEKDDITKQQVLEQYDCVIGVADVDLQINRGEIFCIMGLSGSGKSTLVRHINRLLEPTKGRIIVNGCAGVLGRRVATLPKHPYRNGVSELCARSA